MRLGGIGLVVAVAVLSSAFAHAGEGAAPTHYGVELGFAFEQHIATNDPSSGTQLGILHVQVITRIGHTRASQQERLELVNEVSVIESLRPVRRFIIGGSEIFRYTFPSQRRYRIFVDAGAGITSSSLHSPDIVELDGWLQYQLRVGVGLKRRFGGKTGLAEYCFGHLSNHDTLGRNLGLNYHTLIVGINF